MIIDSSAVSMTGKRSYSSTRSDSYSSSTMSAADIGSMISNRGSFYDLLGGLTNEDSSDEPIPSSNYSNMKNPISRTRTSSVATDYGLGKHDQMKIRFATINYLLQILFSQ